MRRTRSTRRGNVLRGVALLVLAIPAYSSSAAAPLNFADLSLEELGEIEITSVSKRPERLANAAASVFVITADDIRRSGATSLPEALRIAPNLHVAQTSASGYVISARGMNGSINSAPNKLLVMIDGRSVYTPLFSGVFWDVQDVMLEDVERIEVISGPGGTLWGVNAVNGVINVITKSAADTQGGLAIASVGNQRNGAAFRHGGVAGEDGYYRVYGKYSDHDHLYTDDGRSVDDAWHKSQVGFRADWDRGGEQVMVQGNAYRGRIGQPEPGSLSVSGTDIALDTIETAGVNLTGRWEHLLDGGSRLSLQAYYDRTERTIPPTISQTLDIIDLQLQHSLLPIGRHTLTWGANYRYGRDRVTNNDSVIVFLPAHVNQSWSSLFAQDEITLRDDLRLIAGARVEHNPYTGAEFLPNVRLAWKFAPDHLLWTAASRAVRAPSRLDVDAFSPARPPFLLVGGPDVRSEVANVLELGYRGRPTPRLSYSVTAFHTDYDHLRTQELEFDEFGNPVRIFFASEMEGRTTGIEMWGAYQATRHWRLFAGYTALDDRLRVKPGSTDTQSPSAVGKNPAHTWQLRSSLAIAPNRDFDLAVRHVAALSNPDVPSYTAVDARFAWRLQPDLELSVIGQNLFGSHAEYGSITTRSELERSVFLKLLWQL